ncbi:MAG: restriction endonuclease [Planctomycetes bacterium]|nr:restriction endonuclease [Planctomycetota bacterium]
MALSRAQMAIVQKARALGAGKQGVALTEAACCYLLAIEVQDLNLATQFPELPRSLIPFFGQEPLADREIAGLPFLPLFERLTGLVMDADTYFSCLAWVHKLRLKYELVLKTQAIPTMDQVGPRGLLQYGTVPDAALPPLMQWRKWFFDIDNRAAQLTGYLFEPIFAAALGGTPASAKKSPVRRRDNPSKGRQVDCVREQDAYEFKIRLTIAASGQGRWSEELGFPSDCQASGFRPILVVLDPTPNPRLTELQEAFRANGGEAYIGDAAWKHLEAEAGEVMGRFLEQYVRQPIQSLLAAAPAALPPLTAVDRGDSIELTIGGVLVRIARSDDTVAADEEDEIPDDIDDQVPGL